MDRLAVLDLGSNTFHLLIVEKQNRAPYFKELYKQRQYIYLASQGKSMITSEKLDLAIDCLIEFKEITESFQCREIRAVATAAIRSADNSEFILEQIRERSGILVELISGEREAELIHKGILCLDREIYGPGLIMDIGGGSVEFIIQNNGEIVFSASYNIGISFIRNEFIFSEPVKDSEITDFYNHLDQELSELIENIYNNKIVYLIGSSGSFEIIEALNNDIPSTTGNIYLRSQVEWIAEEILKSNKAQRFAIDKMPTMRADLSKEAFLLIHYFLQKFTSLREVLVSPYALKEGLISENFA